MGVTISTESYRMRMQCVCGADLDVSISVLELRNGLDGANTAASEYGWRIRKNPFRAWVALCPEHAEEQ